MRFLLIILLLNSLQVLGQEKPPMDTAAFKKWPDLGTPAMSNDGRFVFYRIHNNEFNVDTLVLQSTDAKWKLNVIGAKTYPVSFTIDSKKVIYIDQLDNLCIQELGKSQVIRIANVPSFTAVQEGIGEWLIYQLKGAAGELVAYSLKTDKKRVFSGAVNHLLSRDGKVLVVQQQEAGEQSLLWVTLADAYVKSVWKGDKASNLTFDHSGRQLAFLTSPGDCKYCGPSLWCYNSSAGKLNRIIEDKSAETDSTMQIDRIQNFSKDGRSVFFYIKEREKPVPAMNPRVVPLNVWSYTDTKLQSLQLKEMGTVNTYLAVINLMNKQLIRVENENERAIPMNDYFMLIEKRAGNIDLVNEPWNTLGKKSYSLLSLKNGSRTALGALDSFDPIISQYGKYILFYDPSRKDYFSLEANTQTLRNITKDIKTSWGRYYVPLIPRGIMGWAANDGFVFIYDHNDIWQIDPRGLQQPINLTNGYGKKHDLIFSYRVDSYNNNRSLNGKLYLSAFNFKSKDDGFYLITASKQKDPEKLFTGKYIFDISNGASEIPNGNAFAPIKALHAEGYILKRSGATEFGNYFYTSNFKDFVRLSDIAPQKKFNWYTTELHSWISLDGNPINGVLYKPENFDPARKYPIIFKYYQRKSDGLNAYIKPDYLENNANVNIPYYVSNGYLIVALDIEFKKGEVGQSVLNSVLPAVDYFSKMSFVDNKRMGINSYSFGGYSTYFLVTHTDKFAAACPGGGPTDVISHFSGIKLSGVNVQEFDQLGMGAPLWDIPELYIKNSPIFSVKNVTTPLLMMHNPNDDAVNFSQATEFFTALRRLGKRAWLMEYENQGHGVLGKAMIDYSERQKQFFDHYLMDKPAPLWMLEGRPAKLKGVDDKLGLDTLDRTPGPGLVSARP
jgi:dipeptidyl aminopeptidase/acylaminoacyl peptidase